jgi:hypothetical protein
MLQHADIRDIVPSAGWVSNMKEVVVHGTSSATRTAADEPSEFTVTLPTMPGELRAIRLHNIVLPDTRRAVRSGTTAPLELRMRFSTGQTMIINPGGGDAEATFAIPATLTPLERVNPPEEEPAVWGLAGGASHGLEALAALWPSTPLVISGEDAGQLPTVVSETTLSVPVSTAAAALYLPELVSLEELLTVLSALAASVATSAGALLSLRQVTVPFSKDVGLVRVASSSISPSLATLQLSPELARAVRGVASTFSWSLAPGDSALETPGVDAVSMRAGTYSASVLLTLMQASTGVLVRTTGSLSIGTLSFSTAETRVVSLTHGFYCGTRLASALAHACQDTFDLPDAVALVVQFHEASGLFTISAPSPFSITFTSSFSAALFGFTRNELSGASTYVSDTAVLTNSGGGVPCVLELAYDTSLRQATASVVPPPPVFVDQVVSGESLATNINMNGVSTAFRHGLRTGDVVRVLDVEAGTTVLDWLSADSTASVAMGIEDVPEFASVTLANHSGTSGMAVIQLVASERGLQATFNCNAAVVVRRARGRHSIAPHLGLNPATTVVRGSTILPRIMVVSPPSQVAVELQGASTRLETQEIVADDGVTRRHVLGVINVNTLDASVFVPEPFRAARVLNTATDSEILVRLLDVRDLQMMDFGDADVRVSFVLQFSAPVGPEPRY